MKYKKIKFDCNVESFKQNLGNNINIAQDIGDIDILFLDEKYKIIYVCECKHNRSRFDMNNWKRDYSNFKDKYEDQLTRKVNWVDQNKEIIENHFKVNYGSAFKENISEYDIRGIFIINAPTIYMFNGKFRALTIEDFTNLINDAYTNIIFEFTNEKTLETFRIENPYFDNIMKHLGK